MKAADEKTATTTTEVAVNKKTDQNGDTNCTIKDNSHGPIFPGVFPEEVLERVFFVLDDPDDLFAVSNASPQFRRILEPCKLVWLFDMVFPLIYPNIDKEDILRCRVVCKGWNKTVDKFLETHPIIRSLEQYPHQPNIRRTSDVGNKHGPQYAPTLVQKQFHGNCFRTGRSILQFMRKTLSHPRNPFLLRYVDLANCPTLEPHQEYFWFNVEHLLQRFGRHIWHIHLCPWSIGSEPDTFDDCYVTLQKALVQLPNLRKLSISGFKSFDILYPADNDEFPRIDLADVIRYFPLPALPYLEVMEYSISDHPKTALVIDELMTRYASQIKKIFLSSSTWQKDKIQYKYMANLQELNISVNDTNLACVQMIESLNAPLLSKIYINFLKDAEIMPILKALKNYCPSVTYLGLWFYEKLLDDYEVMFPPQFHLEEVKTLELVESIHVSYEQLLSYFTNLEHVLILYDPDQFNADDNENDSDEEEQHLPQSEIRELTHSQIYKSGIWERMKTLKEFTLATMGKDLEEEQIVSKQQFTREMYEYLKKQ